MSLLLNFSSYAAMFSDLSHSHTVSTSHCSTGCMSMAREAILGGCGDADAADCETPLCLQLDADDVEMILGVDVRLCGSALASNLGYVKVLEGTGVRGLSLRVSWGL